MADDPQQAPVADVEPWLRGTHGSLDPVVRGVLHALELADEDITKWCHHLTDEELNSKEPGLEPVAFHLRHISRSLDRLLTYAEGKQLSAEQFAGMKSELNPGATHAEVFSELAAALENAKSRVAHISPVYFHDVCNVGKKMLPTSVGGLVVHVADHTQRHVGQAVTTAKVIAAKRQTAS
jgi:uncharacterized damage-inducible protein DinB